MRTKNWSRENLAWLAGFIEGEGNFSPDRGRLPRIKLCSTDHDVVEKACEIAGFGKVYGPFKNPGPDRSKTYKLFVMWKVTNADEAYALMAAIYPFMGQRRQEKIGEVLTLYRRTRVKKFLMCGTIARYKRGCRCRPCTDAIVSYVHKFRVARRERMRLAVNAESPKTNVRKKRSDIGSAAIS